MAPRVSVIMATYNDAPFLRKAVDSILTQTFEDFEFIVIDDASTDETPAILESYTDLRLIFLRNTKNLKLAASLNKGLEMARGELIARMDSDDISLPERLEKQVAFMQRNSDVAVIGTQVSRMDRAENVKSISHQPLSHGLIIWEYLSRLAYPVTHATIVARREVMLDAGGYNVNFPREQDGELFLRLLPRYKFSNLPDCLYQQRHHRQSRGEAARVFDVSYPLTLQIRRAFITDVLQLSVGEELRYLIYPPTRRHRQRLGVKLSVSEVKQAITLLQCVLEALTVRQFLTYEEQVLASNELSETAIQLASLSEELWVRSSQNVPFTVIARTAMQRLAKSAAAKWQDLR